MYKEYEYANERLSGTVVRLNNGEPIFVTGVSEGLKVHFNTLDKSELVTDLKNVDVTSAPLGFMNHYKFGAVYITRIPKRRDWKQGLRPSNVSPSGMITYTDIMLAIAGNYVPINMIAEQLKSRKVSHLAFHRHWAVDSKGVLIYKWNQVGTLNVITGAFTFNEQFAYLESRYYEDIVNANLQEVGFRAAKG